MLVAFDMYIFAWFYIGMDNSRIFTKVKNKKREERKKEKN